MTQLVEFIIINISMFGFQIREREQQQVYRGEQVAVVNQYDRDMMQQQVVDQIDQGQLRPEQVIDYGYPAQQLAYDNYVVNQDQILRQEVQQQQFLREEEVVNNFQTPFYMQDRREQRRDQRTEDREIRRDQRFEDRQDRGLVREQFRDVNRFDRQEMREDRKFERQQDRQDRILDGQEEREQRDIWRDERRNDREVLREQRRDQRMMGRQVRRGQRQIGRQERRDEGEFGREERRQFRQERREDHWQQKQERREQRAQRNYIQAETRQNQAQVMQEQQVDGFGNGPPMMELHSFGGTINSPDKLQSPVYYHHFFEWKEGVGCISNGQVSVGDKSVRLSDLGKVKITKELAINSSCRLKLTHLTGDVLFSVDCDRTLNGLTLHYLWFARIITQKLYLKGCDLSNPYVPQRTFTNSNIKSPSIHGIIYKQSQYFKSWELRYVAINSDGLFSFKDQSGGESFVIKRDSANELWTRFDIHERMLVIKVHHSSRKTEFGIPIVDYCHQGLTNWLYHFYRLLFPL